MHIFFNARVPGELGSAIYLLIFLHISFSFKHPLKGNKNKTFHVLDIIPVGFLQTSVIIT